MGNQNGVEVRGVERDMPQKIHFSDFWSNTFCSVGGSVSSAIGPRALSSVMWGAASPSRPGFSCNRPPWPPPTLRKRFRSEVRQPAFPRFPNVLLERTRSPPTRERAAQSLRAPLSRPRAISVRITYLPIWVVRLIPLRMLLQQTLCQQDAPTTLFSESYTRTRSRVQETTRRSSGQNTGWTVRHL